MTYSEVFVDSPQSAHPVRLLLTGLSVVFIGFLWLVFAALLLRLGHFSRDISVICPIGGLAFFLGLCSFGAHFFQSALSEWKSYPFWLDETDQKKSSFTLSLPNLLISFLLLGWHQSWGTAAIVLFLFVLEFAVSRSAPWFGETAGHFLRTRFAQNNSSHSRNQTGTTAEPFSKTDFPPHSAESPSHRIEPFECSEVIKLHPNEIPCSEEEEIDEEAEVPPPEDLLITQNRCLNPDGSQRVEGWFRVPFSPGETVSVCHLAFCPPFQARPHLQLIQLEGDEVQISPTMIEPFGARIEIKRTLPQYGFSFDGEEKSDPAIDRSVRICFFADEETASSSEKR